MNDGQVSMNFWNGEDLLASGRAQGILEEGVLSHFET